MVDVFISYAREDAAVAAGVAAALTDEGWSIWLDTEILAGSRWREVIEREISAADCVLVLWSKQSVTSHWVKEEANFALTKGVLCPALIEPDVQIPFGYTTIQSAKLWDWNGARDHPGYVCLRLAVAGLAPSPKQPALATAQAKDEKPQIAAPDAGTQPIAANNPMPPRRTATEQRSADADLRGGDGRVSSSPISGMANPTTSKQAPTYSASRSAAAGDYVDLSSIRLLEWPVLAVFMVGVAILLAETVLRYGFNSPPVWGFEVTTALIGLAMAGATAMAADRGMGFVSPAARRLSGGRIEGLARRLDLGIGLATAIILSLSHYAKASYEFELERTYAATNLQMAPVTFVFAAAFGLMGLALIRQALPSARHRQP